MSARLLNFIFGKILFGLTTLQRGRDGTPFPRPDPSRVHFASGEKLAFATYLVSFGFIVWMIVP